MTRTVPRMKIIEVTIYNTYSMNIFLLEISVGIELCVYRTTLRIEKYFL